MILKQVTLAALDQWEQPVNPVTKETMVGPGRRELREQGDLLEQPVSGVTLAPPVPKDHRDPKGLLATPALRVILVILARRVETVLTELMVIQEPMVRTVAMVPTVLLELLDYPVHKATQELLVYWEELVLLVARDNQVLRVILVILERLVEQVQQVFLDAQVQLVIVDLRVILAPQVLLVARDRLDLLALLEVLADRVTPVLLALLDRVDERVLLVQQEHRERLVALVWQDALEQLVGMD